MRKFAGQFGGCCPSLESWHCGLGVGRPAKLGLTTIPQRLRLHSTVHTYYQTTSLDACVFVWTMILAMYSNVVVSPGNAHTLTSACCEKEKRSWFSS